MGTSSHGGAASSARRFWVAVFCFALANALAWAAWVQWMRSDRHLLRIEAFEPGDEAIVSPRQPLKWRFNLEVAPPAADAPGTITPAVAGRWEWPDARTLLFVPDEEMAPATRYRLELSPRALRTADDFRLAETPVYTIMTAPLRVRGVRQAGTMEDGRCLLEFTFSDRVLPADLKAALTLRHLGRPVGFESHGEAAGPVLRILTDPLPPSVAEEALEVSIREGLAGTSGPLGLQQSYSQVIPLGRGISCTGARRMPDRAGGHRSISISAARSAPRSSVRPCRSSRRSSSPSTRAGPGRAWTGISSRRRAMRSRSRRRSRLSRARPRRAPIRPDIRCRARSASSSPTVSRRSGSSTRKDTWAPAATARSWPTR